MSFIGTHSLSLDAKGRLSMPTRFRPALEAESSNRLVVTAHPDGCLALFPLPNWETLAAQLLSLPADAHAWRRLLLGYASEIELDSAGRLHIPPELREYSGIERDAVLVGVGQKFELWNKVAHGHSIGTVRGQPSPESVRNINY